MGYVRTALAWLVVFLALAAPAGASTISVDGGKLVYLDEADAQDEFDLVPGALPGTYRLYDYTGTVQTGNGCALLPDPDSLLIITCSGVSAGVELRTGGSSDFAFVVTDGVALDAQTGAGDDFLFSDTGVADVLDGGPGGDYLNGGPGADKLLGGEGDDLLAGGFEVEFSPPEESESSLTPLMQLRLKQEPAPTGAEGDPDELDGGEGDDFIDGGSGPDTLVGGEGFDLVSYASREEAVTVSLDGSPGNGAAGENDAVGADIESVATGSGDDVVLGNSESQSIRTGAGADVVDAGKGEDMIDAGPGDDRVLSRDRKMDFISCAEGRDSAKVDAIDEVYECEKVDRPKGSSGKTGGIGLQLKATVTATAIRFSGRLALGPGADQRPCAGARVLIETSGRKARRKRLALMGSDCRFTAKLRLRLIGKATARATFPGTDSLPPAQSRRIVLRPRR